MEAARSLHIAAFDQVDGLARSLGTHALLPGTQVRALGVEGGMIVAALLVHGEGDEACCPSRKQTVRWRPRNGELEDAGSAGEGPLAARDLDGSRWRIVAASPSTVAPAEFVGTLGFDGSSFVLEGGCARWTGTFALLHGLVLDSGGIERSAKECAASDSAAAPELVQSLAGARRLSFTRGECASKAPRGALPRRPSLAATARPAR